MRVFSLFELNTRPPFLLQCQLLFHIQATLHFPFLPATSQSSRPEARLFLPFFFFRAPYFQSFLRNCIGLFRISFIIDHSLRLFDFFVCSFCGFVSADGYLSFRLRFRDFFLVIALRPWQRGQWQPPPERR